ncbi:MAG: phosphoribosylformylglycinamidine synthase subunit PurS [Spirochaetia bacterium]|nr:phosphoribosylformylglycinamidine synthase subunit PurS [Spirochaetia bacterium]
MHYHGKVKVCFKKSVLEPQGKAVELQLKETRHTGISEIRVGKWIDVKMEAGNDNEARQKLQKLADEILYNPVMETCEIEVERI